MNAMSRKDTMPWVIIICGSLIAMLTFGPRSAMGFFQLPLLADTGWTRETFGLAIAIPLFTPGHPPTLMLVAGANAECQPAWLVQFAQMGAVYARGAVRPVCCNPRVALASSSSTSSQPPSMNWHSARQVSPWA